MTNAKHAQTPLPTGYMPTPNEREVNPQMRTLIQQIIGSLLYIMLRTHPDIAFAVTKLAQFAATYKEHLDKAKYVLRYLAGTVKYVLMSLATCSPCIFWPLGSPWEDVVI